jgi:hypothetical protein
LPYDLIGNKRAEKQFVRSCASPHPEHRATVPKR